MWPAGRRRPPAATFAKGLELREPQIAQMSQATTAKLQLTQIRFFRFLAQAPGWIGSRREKATKRQGRVGRPSEQTPLCPSGISPRTQGENVHRPKDGPSGEHGLSSLHMPSPHAGRAAPQAQEGCLAPPTHSTRSQHHARQPSCTGPLLTARCGKARREANGPRSRMAAHRKANLPRFRL